jgi:hypothetical protein
MLDIEKLEDSPHLLDLLVQMEDVLDSMDVYVFKNWIDGEIVEGPKVRRYWLDMTLKYPYDKMPDPRAGLRLLKHGVRVDFSKAHEDDSGDAKPVEGEGEKDSMVWLVHVSIPRRLIVEINAGQLDFYDDEIDSEDVEDAQDSGVTDETGYTAPEEGGLPPPGGPEMAPPAPGGPGGPPPAQPPMGGPPRG